MLVCLPPYIAGLIGWRGGIASMNTMDRGNSRRYTDLTNDAGGSREVITRSMDSMLELIQAP